ncbi:MAG: hypothetical protein SF053_15765 [Bacteroidia bacterium]|nr:hypothetical protein [Bacteroidia bacterium]
MHPLTSETAGQLLQDLRHILLDPDRVHQEAARARLAELERLLGDPQAFSQHLEPYLEQHIGYLQEHFPHLFGKYLTTAIKRQIQDSRDEVIDALYPIMGKLIQRYLRAEIERISQLIDERLRDPFSWETLKLRFKAWRSGVSYEEMLLRTTARPEVAAVMMISRQDGLLLGHYAASNLLHPDMVAGMLTGIKSFVEHAFETGTQELQTLAWERHTILIYSFETYYTAVVVSGTPDESFRARLLQVVMDVQAHLDTDTTGPVTAAVQSSISAGIQTHFHGFNQVDQ